MRVCRCIVLAAGLFITSFVSRSVCWAGWLVGVDLTQFRRWYSQAGTPKVKVDTHYNASENVFSLTLSQSYPNQQEPLFIPIKIGLLDSKTGLDLLPPTLLQLNEIFIFELFDFLVGFFQFPLKRFYPLTRFLLYRLII